MKKLLGMILCIVLLCGGILFVTSCGAGEKVSGTDLSSKSMTLEDKTLSVVLPNATTEFSFSEDITVNENATYVVASDEYGQNAFHAKVVPLNEGDNLFYPLT